MKILVVGAAGFIGAHLVEYFLKRGDYVTGCDIVNVDCAAHQFFVIDPKQQDFSNLFKKNIYDFCINASGSASVTFSIENPAEDFRLNVSNVNSLLHAIRVFNPGCSFINFSSAAVYGNPKVLPIHENTPLSPLSPYGFHKMISEQICFEFYKLYKIKTISLRVFSAFGPELKKQLFWDLYNKSKTSKSIRLFGTGRESRDFIYISDLCLAVDMLMKNAKFCGQAINIASGTEISISDVAGKFLNAIDPSLTFTFSGEEKKGDPTNWRADISELKKLGFVSQTSFDEGITQMLSWLKNEQ